MSSAANKYFESVQKMFDPSQAAEAQRRGIEAVTAANQALSEGVQAISRRQADLVQASVQDALEASRAAISSGTPEAGLEKQAALVKNLFEGGVENLRESIETLTKSSFEAFDVINKFTAESLSEAKKKAKK